MPTLTPEQLAKRRSTNKKIFTIFGVIILLFVAIVSIGYASNQQKQETARLEAKAITDKITVKPTIVKPADDGKYYYWFELHNTGDKTFNGSIWIQTFNKDGAPTPLGGTWSDDKALEPGLYRQVRSTLDAPVSLGGKLSTFNYELTHNGIRVKYETEKPLTVELQQ